MIPCNDYVVLDLETTGLDAKKNKIIEIGALRVRNGQIVKTFSTLVQPGCRLEPNIIELTGITDEELKTAPLINEVINNFLEFTGNDVLLGHGILFDYSFVKRAAVNYADNPEFERRGIDTLAISRKYLSELPSRRLGDLCKYFGIAHSPHRALNDAEATHELYQKLLKAIYYGDDESVTGNKEISQRISEEDMTEKLRSSGETNDYREQDIRNEKEKIFAPKPLIYKVKKEAPVMQKQIEWLNRAYQYYDIVPKYDVYMLTKNEASREMDRIIRTYGRI